MRRIVMCFCLLIGAPIQTQAQDSERERAFNACRTAMGDSCGTTACRRGGSVRNNVPRESLSQVAAACATWGDARLAGELPGDYRAPADGFQVSCVAGNQASCEKLASGDIDPADMLMILMRACRLNTLSCEPYLEYLARNQATLDAAQQRSFARLANEVAVRACDAGVASACPRITDRNDGMTMVLRDHIRHQCSWELGRVGLRVDFDVQQSGVVDDVRFLMEDGSREHPTAGQGRFGACVRQAVRAARFGRQRRDTTQTLVGRCRASDHMYSPGQCALRPPPSN